MTEKLDLCSGLSDELRERIVSDAKSSIKRLLGTDSYTEVSVAAEALLKNNGSVSIESSDEALSVSEHPLATTLLAVPAPNPPQIVKTLEDLRAVVIGAALIFVFRTGESDKFNRPKRALRVVRRLLSDPKFASFASRFPTLENLERHAAARTLEQLQQILENEAAEAESARNYHNRLQEIIDLLCNVGPRQNRTYTGEHTRIFDKLSDLTFNVTSPNGDAYRFKFHDVKVSDARDVVLDEFAGSVPDAIDIGFEQNDAEKTTFDELSDQATFLAHSSFEPSNSAGLESGALTSSEARQIWNAVEAQQRAGQLCSGAVLCGTSLVLGVDVAILASANLEHEAPGKPFWTRLNNSLSLAMQMDVTGQAARVNATTKGVFRVQPPVLLIPPLLRYLETELNVHDANEHARKWLKTALNSHRPARLSRLARYLEDVLKQEEVDPAVIDALRFRSAEQSARLFYASPKLSTLNKAAILFRRNGLNFKAPNRENPIVAGSKSTTRIGSISAPSQIATRQFFQGLAQSVETNRPNWPTPRNVARFHGAFVDYTAAALTLLTGRRPNGEAFERVNQTAGRRFLNVLVSDKENRHVSAARLIPLCPIAQTQIKHYLDHLKNIETLYRLSSPQIADAAEEARSGHGPLFFLIEETTRHALPLMAPDLWRRTGTPQNKAANWARHFLRRELPEISGTIPFLDHVFGHGGTAGNALRPESGSGTRELNPVRDAFETIASQVEIQPVEGVTL